MDADAPAATTTALAGRLRMEGKMNMNPTTNLAEVRNAELLEAAREHQLARRVAAANRWSRIAAWADNRARRAAEELNR